MGYGLMQKGMSMDYKRVYEEEELLSWYFVLIIQGLKSGFSKKNFGSLFIHNFPVPPCLDHYLLDVLISL
jgi:hypothetical protein